MIQYSRWRLILLLPVPLEMLKRIIDHITTKSGASAEHYCAPES
jgi:hypothetical protein